MEADLRNPDVDHHTPLVDPSAPSPYLGNHTPSPYPSHHTHYPSVYLILVDHPPYLVDNHQLHVGHRLMCLDRDRFDLGILRLFS